MGYTKFSVRYLTVHTLICFIYNVNVAQEDTKTTQQIWLDYNQKWHLSERLTISGPIGVKTISTDAWNRFYISPEIALKLRKTILKGLDYNDEMRAGMDLYFNQNTNGDNVLEVSPFQGYSLTWPKQKYLDIRHYLKLRERFQINTRDWSHKFGLKLSYELTFTIRFHGDLWQYGSGFYLPIALRFYWNLIDAVVFNNVFRFTPGLGYQFNNEWKGAFLLGYNRSRNGAGDQFRTNDIIYQFRVYHTITR